MSLRIGASSFGETRLRMLRIVRRGDRHDPRDLVVSCRFEGDFSPAFQEGRPAGVVPGEALKNLVHATALACGDGEIEPLGIALCRRVLAENPRIARVRVEIEERPWSRSLAGGKPQGQVFVGAADEARTTAVTSNGPRTAVVSGIAGLRLMRSSGFQARDGGRQREALNDGLPPLLVGDLTARWSYSSSDVTFGPFRAGVRTAILDTVATHAARSLQHMLYAIADVVLASYVEISDVSLAFLERPYRPADLFSAGIENPDELFVAADEPAAIVEVTVERDRGGPGDRDGGR